MENDLKGNENYFDLTGGSSYRGFELPGVDCICFSKFYKIKFGIFCRILPLATFGSERINGSANPSAPICLGSCLHSGASFHKRSVLKDCEFLIFYRSNKGKSMTEKST